MAEPIKDPAQQAQEDAAAKKAARDAAYAEELAAQQALHADELAAQQAYNTAQYENQGQIIKDIEDKISVAKAKDETAQKREKAFRYISGLGDTLSSLANLVGTAHGAANQKQTYNSSAVVQKAEEARKARKLEMYELSKRQDEMKARLDEMKAAGSLAEAQTGIRHRKEQAALKADQNAREIAAAKAAYEQQKDAQNYTLKAAELNLKAGTAAAEAGYKQGMLGVRQGELAVKRQAQTDKAKKQREYARNAQFGKAISFVDNEGNTFSIGERTLQRNSEFALPTMREDIAKQAGFSSFADYERWRGLNERKQRKYFEEKGIEPDQTLIDALRQLRSADASEVEDIVKKYGRLSPDFIKQLKAAALKDEEEFSTAWGEDEGESPEERSGSAFYEFED